MKQNRLVLFLGLMILLAGNLKAEDNLWWNLFLHKDSAITKYDTAYVDPLLDQITLRLYTGYKGNELSMDNDVMSTQVLSHNSKYQLGLGFGYRWLILNSSIASPFKSKYNKDRGGDFAWDTQVNVYAPRFQFDLKFQWIDGYYVKTTNEIYTNFKNEGPYELRDDMHLRSLGGGAFYSTNKNYLHKHGFDQTKKMKRSGGTLIGGIKGNYLNVFSDSILMLNSNPIQEDFNNSESFTMSAGFGGAYTLLFGKNWFASIHGMGFISGQNTIWRMRVTDPSLVSTTISEANTVYSYTLRGSLGYNSEKHFIGLYGVFDNVLNNGVLENRIDNYYTSLKLIYAYRLSTSDFRRIFLKK